MKSALTAVLITKQKGKLVRTKDTHYKEGKKGMRKKEMRERRRSGRLLDGSTIHIR